MELIQEYSEIFHVILVVLAVLTIFCLIRAVQGPTIADRLVAVNMMGTIVMVMIAVLALLINEGYLVDICLIYAMISFLAVVVLTKVYTGVYIEYRKRLEEKVYIGHRAFMYRCGNLYTGSIRRIQIPVCAEPDACGGNG